MEVYYQIGGVSQTEITGALNGHSFNVTPSTTTVYFLKQVTDANGCVKVYP